MRIYNLGYQIDAFPIMSVFLLREMRIEHIGEAAYDLKPF